MVLKRQLERTQACQKVDEHVHTNLQSFHDDEEGDTERNSPAQADSNMLDFSFNAESQMPAVAAT